MDAGQATLDKQLCAQGYYYSLSKMGPPGYQGFQGAQGNLTVHACTGDTGPTGSQGATGYLANTGATGVEGPQGPTGQFNFVITQSLIPDQDSVYDLGATGFGCGAGRAGRTSGRDAGHHGIQPPAAGPGSVCGGVMATV